MAVLGASTDEARLDPQQRARNPSETASSSPIPSCPRQPHHQVHTTDLIIGFLISLYVLIGVASLLDLPSILMRLASQSSLDSFVSVMWRLLQPTTPSWVAFCFKFPLIGAVVYFFDAVALHPLTIIVFLCYVSVGWFEVFVVGLSCCQGKLDRANIKEKREKKAAEKGDDGSNDDLDDAEREDMEEEIEDVGKDGQPGEEEGWESEWAEDNA